MRVAISDIPTWLHNSEFYRSLDSDDGDNFIDIPSDKHMKFNDKVNSKEELKSYLKTCMFWGIDLPDNVSESTISFIQNNLKDSLRIINKFSELDSLAKEVDILKFNLRAEINYKEDFEYFLCDLIYSFENKMIWRIDGMWVDLFFIDELRKSIQLNKKFHSGPKLFIHQQNHGMNGRLHIFYEDYNLKFEKSIIYKIENDEYDEYDEVITDRFNISVNKFNRDFLVKDLKKIFQQCEDSLSQWVNSDEEY